MALYHIHFRLSIGFWKFPKLFLHFFAQGVDFSEQVWYYNVRGGEKMYSKRIESCGARIRAALKIKGMKQSELCAIADVPKSSLSLYLSGAYEPKQDRIYAMAKALNVSEAWLMGYDVSMERKKDSPTDLTEGESFFLSMDTSSTAQR
jgi:lambda repressor-like predicted transcriptional regulator